MRILPFLVLLVAASAKAQGPLELTDPLLLIDGQRVPVSGAPLLASDFEALEMEVPRWGTLLVSPNRFAGARRAGDFDGTRLVLVVAGRSVRLRSRTPILSPSALVPAYAQLVQDPMTPTEGPVYVRLAETSRPAAPPLISPVEPPSAPRAAPDALARQLEALRAERDQLRTALAQVREERDDARLRLDVLREEVSRLQQEVSGVRPSEQQLRRERDALREEVLRLRASLDAVGTPVARPAPSPADALAPDPPRRLTLPDFDLARLQNPSQIQNRLLSTPYPAWAESSGLGGDVLVLFQTDDSGAVVRTAVPRPIGGGLDALAEEIVRAMRFRPVRADGQPTRLRSQVVVRFTP